MELEHPLLKVPFEATNRSFRSGQKAVERELVIVDKFVKDLIKKDKEKKNSDAAQTLDKLSKRIENVKEKLDHLEEEQQHHLNSSQERIKHLEDMPKENSDSAHKRRWNKIRLDRIIVDYLLREGYYETAEQLSNSSNIEELVDIRIFVESKKVIERLEQGKCDKALEWCNENKSKLKKIKSSLEFNLRVQEFLEKVRAGGIDDAIKHSRKYLSAYSDTHFADVSQAMATLAFGGETKCQPYKKLFDSNRWNQLIDQFKIDNYRIHSLTTEPLININLQAGLYALKTPRIYEEEYFNVNDPLCHPNFQKLAHDLPFAHHNNSKLVCRISGERMDDDNYPMVLPNGNAYSRKAMEDMAAKNDGVIHDPRSGEEFLFEDLKKTYIV
eukprot:gb/GECH01013642.1/.p1 GENE.gb/GECH01013642.1/~~gb/GECH01013642.1/.p1  ORF type:complete len:384 (+),score=108.61 gb/GECH01013642.1/:1-1152(+)